MKKLNKINDPFGCFCYNLGFRPTVYSEALTYEEQLLWLIDFLQKTVIPAVNDNTEAVEELQGLYIELKSYVDNYFDNLDVQEEIDNKLDDMVEQGTLQEIITQYLQINGVLAFNTLFDMSYSDNLIEGSTCYCLGEATYNDGKGGHYKVRTITSGDIVDDYNIVALDVSDTLIAERIVDENEILCFDTISDMSDSNKLIIGSTCYCLGKLSYNDGWGGYYKVRTKDVSDTPDGYNIVSLDISNSIVAERIIKKSKSILLSDSYYDYSPDETISIQNRWWYKFFEMNGITDYQTFNAGGIGFYQEVGDVNFLQLLINNYDNITDKAYVDKIFVFGGYNDAFDNNTTITNINDAIDDFVEYCKETYPNATVYIGEIGYDTNIDVDGTTRRNKINNKVVPAYSNTSYNSANPYIYLSNLEYCLHNKDYMSTDGIHPNTIGHNALANAINCAYNNCYNQLPINEEYYSVVAVNSDETVNGSLYVRNTIPVKSIRINQFGLSFTANYPTLLHGSGTTIGKFNTSKLLIPVYDIPFEVTALIGTTNTGYWVCPCKLMFTQTGDITLSTNLLNELRNNWYEIENVNYIEITPVELTTTMDVL